MSIANNRFLVSFLNNLIDVIDSRSSGSQFHKLQPLLIIDFLPTSYSMLTCKSLFPLYNNSEYTCFVQNEMKILKTTMLLINI